MRLITCTTSLLCIINLVLALSAEDSPSESIPPTSSPSIETTLPNYSYLLKLDCISCPFLVRHSNRNEWEKEPRPNQLTLALSIEGAFSHLQLQGDTLYPLWYDRQAPVFYGSPDQSAPPFVANQIGVNETLQREENNNGYGMPVRQFELAYEFNAVTYAPGREVWKWEAFIEFEITGLRHEEHAPKDIPFSSSTSYPEKEGAVPGVNSVVRVIVGYTGYNKMIIKTVGLMPKENNAKIEGDEMEPQRNAAALEEDESITTPTWGGRLRDINGPDMHTMHASFKPGEWNDCGRKDEWGRQIMCKLENVGNKFDDFWTSSPMLARLSLVLVGIVLNGLFIFLLFVSWLAIRSLRGQKVGKGPVISVARENDALLLFGDEELEDEEEKANKGVEAIEAVSRSIHTVEEEDSQQFGPYEQNTGYNLP